VGVDAPDRIRLGVDAPDRTPLDPIGFLGERSAPTLTPGPAASTPPFALCLSAPRRPNSVGVFRPPGAKVPPPPAEVRGWLEVDIWLELDSPPPPLATVPLAGDGSRDRDRFNMLVNVPDLAPPGLDTPVPVPLGTDLDNEFTAAALRPALGCSSSSSVSDNSICPAELVLDSERRFRSCRRLSAVSFWPVALFLLGESGLESTGSAAARRPAIGGDLERTGTLPPASMSSSHAGRSGSTDFFLTTPNVARGPLMAPAFSRAAAARRPKALSPFLEAVRDDPPSRPCAPRPLDPPEFSSGENSSD